MGPSIQEAKEEDYESKASLHYRRKPDKKNHKQQQKI